MGSKPKIRRKPAAAYHHGDLRAALIEAAARAAEKSVDDVRVSEIAAGIGVSAAAPFRHFATRQALLVGVAEEAARRMAERLGRAAARQTDPVDAQRARGVAYVRFAVEEPGFFRVLTSAEVLRDSPLLQEISVANTVVMDAILGRHQDGKVSRVLAQRSAGMLAAQALTYGLARLIVDGHLGRVDADGAEKLAWEITGVLGAGLGGPGGQSR